MVKEFVFEFKTGALSVRSPYTAAQRAFLLFWGSGRGHHARNKGCAFKRVGPDADSFYGLRLCKSLGAIRSQARLQLVQTLGGRPLQIPA